jgi:hypothetical protein
MNGVNSIDFLMDIMLTSIIALYNGKLVLDIQDRKTKVSNMIVFVYNWETYFHSTFEQFIMKFNEYFRHKIYLPFSVKFMYKTKNGVGSNYLLSINDDFYRNYNSLNKEIKIPNLNVVIKELMNEFWRNPTTTYNLKFLNYCKLEFPITAYNRKYNKRLNKFDPVDESTVVKPDIQVELTETHEVLECVPSEDQPLPVRPHPFSSIKNDRLLKNVPLEVQELRSTNEMLSQMIEHIYETMMTSDYDRLQATIFETHAIYSMKSKKRQRCDAAEESQTQKSRVETLTERPSTPVYD